MDNNKPLVTHAQLAQINHWGYVIGAIVFLLALVTFLRRRKTRNAVWAVVALVMAFIPYVVYAWALFYLVVRGFAWFTNKISRPRPPCGRPDCNNGLIIVPGGQDYYHRHPYHGNA